MEVAGRWTAAENQWDRSRATLFLCASRPPALPDPNQPLPYSRALNEWEFADYFWSRLQVNHRNCRGFIQQVLKNSSFVFKNLCKKNTWSWANGIIIRRRDVITIDVNISWSVLFVKAVRCNVAGNGGGGGRTCQCCGRPEAGKQATYLFICPRRKSPCIYFERGGAGGAARGGSQTPLPVWRQKDSPAPRAPRAARASRSRLTPQLATDTHSTNLSNYPCLLPTIDCNLFLTSN